MGKGKEGIIEVNTEFLGGDEHRPGGAERNVTTAPPHCDNSIILHLLPNTIGGNTKKTMCRNRSDKLSQFSGLPFTLAA